MRAAVRWTIAGGSVIGGFAAASALSRARAGDNYTVLSGEPRQYASRHGRVWYTVKGKGSPLLLVHGVHAAASSFEMRRNPDILATRHRVYALDLLGFGLSERPSIVYTGNMYIDLLADFARDVIGPGSAVVASSYSAAYALQAAFFHPDLFSQLILVSPAGFGAQGDVSSWGQIAAHEALRLPLAGEAAFHRLVSKRALREFLRREAYHDPALVSDAMIDYLYTTSHQPGAPRAPLAFITGYLNVDISHAIAFVENPLTVVVGAGSRFPSAAATREAFAANPNVRFEVIHRSRLLPHDERAEEFNDLALRTLSVPAAV